HKRGGLGAARAVDGALPFGTPAFLPRGAEAACRALNNWDAGEDLPSVPYQGTSGESSRMCLPRQEGLGGADRQLGGRGRLMEEAWRVIAPLLPVLGQRGGQWPDHRMVINGIL